jgi:hypothetical protein
LSRIVNEPAPARVRRASAYSPNSPVTAISPDTCADYAERSRHVEPWSWTSCAAVDSKYSATTRVHTWWCHWIQAKPNSMPWQWAEGSVWHWMDCPAITLWRNNIHSQRQLVRTPSASRSATQH